MTPAQVAVNDRIVRDYAARLEAIGYEGDAARFVEGLLLGAISQGYRPIEKPPPLQGPSSTPAARQAAREAAAEAVRAARERRTGAGR